MHLIIIFSIKEEEVVLMFCFHCWFCWSKNFKWNNCVSAGIVVSESRCKNRSTRSVSSSKSVSQSKASGLSWICCHKEDKTVQWHFKMTWSYMLERRMAISSSVDSNRVVPVNTLIYDQVKILTELPSEGFIEKPLSFL